MPPEASPFYATADCRSGAAEKTHRRWVTAKRAQRNVLQTRADTLRVHAASARRIRDTYLGMFASLRTAQSLCVVPLEFVPDTFLARTDALGTEIIFCSLLYFFRFERTQQLFSSAEINRVTLLLSLPLD